LAAQAGVHFLTSALPCESVSEIEGAETAAISQGIVDKIHTPSLTWSGRRRHFAPLLALEPLLVLLSQNELLLTVQTIELLVKLIFP